MTIDIGKYRRQLDAKLAQRQQLEAQFDESNLVVEKCDHDWKLYKKRIQPDHSFRGVEAYFKLLGCEKCKSTKTTELVVVR